MESKFKKLCSKGAKNQMNKLSPNNEGDQRHTNTLAASKAANLISGILENTSIC